MKVNMEFLPEMQGVCFEGSWATRMQVIYQWFGRSWIIDKYNKNQINMYYLASKGKIIDRA